jgi:hypothetical protein
VCEHIAASFRKEQEEMRFRQYITEALRLTTENTTHFMIPGVGNVDYGTYIQKPWRPLSAERGPKPKQAKTGDEIAQDVIAGAGLILKGDAPDGE